MSRIGNYFNDHPTVENFAASAAAVAAIGALVFGVDKTFRGYVDDRGGLVNCNVISPETGGSVMSTATGPSCKPDMTPDPTKIVLPISIPSPDYESMNVLGRPIN